MTYKMKSQIPRKVVKILILIGFVYQLYDLTRDYLRYNYEIDLQVKQGFSYVPSVTICVNPLHRMSSSTNWNNSYLSHMKTLTCKYMDYYLFEYYSCEAVDPFIFIRFKNNTICLTHLNAGYNETVITYDFRFAALSHQRAEFIFHPRFHPSHFERSNRFIVGKGDRSAKIQVNRLDKTLLPFPYSTNCFDYSINRRNNVSSKSQTDCKLEYMRRKELKVCNHNYYWSQHLFDINHQTLHFNQTFTNCSVKVNETILDYICPNDCRIVELLVNKDKFTLNYHGNYVFFEKQKDNYIHLIYLKKMDLITYFSTMGGLISMYLGFCVIYLTEITLDSILKFFAFVIRKRFNSKIKLFMQSMKSISKIIFLYLMCYQLIEMTNIFIDNKERTDISFRVNYRLPKVMLILSPRIDRKSMKFKEKYPKYFKKLKQKSNYWKLERKYLLDLLIKNISELKYLTGFNDLKMTCQVEYENDHAKCPQPSKYIQIYRAHKMSFNYQFFPTSFNSNIIPRSISIDLSGHFDLENMYLKLFSFSILGTFGSNTIIKKEIIPRHINTFTINSIMIKKLSNHKN